MKQLFDTGEDDKEVINLHEKNRAAVRRNVKREVKRLCPKQKDLSAKTKRLLNKVDIASQMLGVTINEGRLDYDTALVTDLYAKEQAALIKHLLNLEQQLKNSLELLKATRDNLKLLGEK